MKAVHKHSREREREREIIVLFQFNSAKQLRDFCWDIILLFMNQQMIPYGATIWLHVNAVCPLCYVPNIHAHVTK